MTRKRFIKLQMAKGYDRNGAGALAAAVRAHGKTYTAANAQDWPRGAAARLANNLMPALKEVAATFNRVGLALAAGAAAFREAMARGDDNAPAS